MKRNYKVLMSLLLTMVVLTMSITPAFAAIPEYGEEYSTQPTKIYSQTFTDVSKSYWAFGYISEMVERGVLSGYPNGYFYPDNTITRAEFAKVMCLAASISVSPVSSTSYADVAASEWFAPYVEAGKYYLSGYVSDGNKYYMPNDNALREDIAVALVKLKGYDTSLYDESILKAMFTDYQSISAGARKYVSVAVEKGLISGYEDNTFRGQNTITRAEAATLLWRAYQYGNGNKVFEKEDFDEPVVTPEPTTKPNTDKPEDEKPNTEPVVTPEPTVEPIQYLYSLKTIASSVSNVDSMVATDDGVIYLDDNKIMEVKKDANKAVCIFTGDNLGYLGTKELTKSQLDGLGVKINSIGYNQNDDCIYALVSQGAYGDSYYMYNVTEKTYSEISSLAIMRCDVVDKTKMIMPGLVFTSSNDIMANRYVIRDNVSNMLITDKTGIASVINNKTYFVTDEFSERIFQMAKTGDWEFFDFYAPNSKFFAANNKAFYFNSNDEIGTVNTNGDYTILLGIADIDNIDGKNIRIDNIKRNTSAVDNNGVIYYWDIDYNCIRQLEHN